MESRPGMESVEVAELKTRWITDGAYENRE